MISFLGIQLIWRASVHSYFQNVNISATRGSIVSKFHLKHHWGEEKANLGFGATSDQHSGFHGNNTALLNSSKYFINISCWAPGEQSLPLWLLVFMCWSIPVL